VLPAINDFWERAELPWPLTTRMAELRVVGEDIEGYGCPGMTPLAVGLIHMELHRGDGSLGTFLGVQSGLAMKSIAMLGSGEQKERWLPTDTIAGLAKLHNTRKAREVIAQARDLLGGNGILLENHVIRHMTDIEVLHTYEGTETMQTLIVGRDITGVGAFV
jgi:alkylation response protein AidB-like acyl-CoA dehydrogenase